MLQVEYNVEHVAEDEVVMESEIVEDDNGPTKQTKEFQQPSKEVDTDESSEERDSDYVISLMICLTLKMLYLIGEGRKLFLETMTIIVTTCLMILTMILMIMNMKWC